MGCAFGELTDRFWDSHAVVQSRYGWSTPFGKKFNKARKYFAIMVAGTLDDVVRRVVHDVKLEPYDVFVNEIFYNLNRKRVPEGNPYPYPDVRPFPKTLLSEQLHIALQLVADVGQFLAEFEAHINFGDAKTLPEMRRLLDDIPFADCLDAKFRALLPSLRLFIVYDTTTTDINKRQKQYVREEDRPTKERC